jgi:peptide/nickel transport system substrate-binding protein
MPRRLWLSAGLLAAGAVLLATARLAGAAPRSGGIFRVGMVGASVQIDPQVSYISTGWWMEYATAAKLYNWSDRGSMLVREVASRVAISNRGRTYTFYLRKGFRFSDGSPVTAKNFAYAIDRVANKDLASPGAAVITDSSGLEIVGAQKVNSGLGTHVSGVRAKGRYKLAIRLVRPDPSFLSKLTMPFFQATSTTLPLSQEVVSGYPSAGPYYFASNEVNMLTTLRRNPHWHGNRPAHVDGVDVRWGLDEDTAFQEVESNQLDETSVSDGNAQTAGQRYGVNKTRFWAMPQNCTGLLPFNRFNRVVGHSVALRKAVNWAVDRTAYAALAGPYAGTPWTHLLPPFLPGSITKKSLQPYSVHPNLRKARSLAGAYVANRKIVVGYRTSSAMFQTQAQLVHDTLVQLGFKPENITMKGYSGGNLYTAMGTRGTDLDMGVSMGFCSDYPDSYFGVLKSLVAGSNYSKKLDAARNRPKALGKLDVEITKNLAPAAAMRTYNNRYVFSGRVAPRSLKFNQAYQDWSIPALTLR